MNKEQIEKKLEALQLMLEEMKIEKEEAEPYYDDEHWFMKDIDEDILLCSLSINDLRTALYKETK